MDKPFGKLHTIGMVKFFQVGFYHTNYSLDQQVSAGYLPQK